MSSPTEQVLLRIYLPSADRAPHEPTNTRLVREARRRGLAGATVLRGILGLGHSGWIRPSSWMLSRHEPVIVEIVDEAARIASFVREVLPAVMIGGMATLERAAVVMYRHRRDSGGAALSLAAMVPALSTLPPIAAEGDMSINETGTLLRVFIGESDRFEGKPLYEAIVQKARELGLSGATVLRGSEGFGAASVVHKASLLEMSTDLPIVIELVDSEEGINKLLPHLETMMEDGMVTMEHVKVLTYREGTAKQAHSAQ
jgi:PII-like signaling protein